MLNISAEYFCGIFQIIYYKYYVKNQRKYLKGLTVVNRNCSANPLSIHTVFPIAVKALKKAVAALQDTLMCITIFDLYYFHFGCLAL